MQCIAMHLYIIDINLVWFLITYIQDYSERSWGVLETGHHMNKSLKFTEILICYLVQV